MQRRNIRGLTCRTSLLKVPLIKVSANLIFPPVFSAEFSLLWILIKCILYFIMKRLTLCENLTAYSFRNKIRIVKSAVIKFYELWYEGCLIRCGEMNHLTRECSLFLFTGLEAHSYHISYFIPSSPLISFFSVLFS